MDNLYSRDTTGLIDRMFSELDLLCNKKITSARARASAALGMVIVETNQLAITHHRLKPRRNGRVLPVQLGTRIIEGAVISHAQPAALAIEHKKAKRRNS